MTGRVARRWPLRLLVLAMGIGAAGYVSSVLSRPAAERGAASRIAAELGTRHVYALPDDPASRVNYPVSSATLTRAGFTVRDCQHTGDQFDCFPWAGMTSMVVGPFFVEVRWGRAAAGLSGGGTRTRYLALFGLVFPLGDNGGWVS
jgi:hypothetical protein